MQMDRCSVLERNLNGTARGCCSETLYLEASPEIVVEQNDWDRPAGKGSQKKGRIGRARCNSQTSWPNWVPTNPWMFSGIVVRETPLVPMTSCSRARRPVSGWVMAGKSVPQETQGLQHASILVVQFWGNSQSYGALVLKAGLKGSPRHRNGIRYLARVMGRQTDLIPLTPANKTLSFGRQLCSYSKKRMCYCDCFRRPKRNEGCGYHPPLLTWGCISQAWLERRPFSQAATNSQSGRAVSPRCRAQSRMVLKSSALTLRSWSRGQLDLPRYPALCYR
jgi:hypothetical protein